MDRIVLSVESVVLPAVRIYICANVACVLVFVCLNVCTHKSGILRVVVIL